MTKKGKLYLIPTVISANTEEGVITPEIKRIIPEIRYFLVENVRTARRYISKLNLGLKIEELIFEVLDKRIDNQQIDSLMKPLVEGQDIGIISESGCPGIADPGSVAVSHAHKIGAQVVPLSGPSSIFMALMASGFSGQRFTFHGYLPIDKKDLVMKIKSMEKDASDHTQVFMDTPYRNQKLFDELLRSCQSNTLLSVAIDITGSKELLKTMSIAEWKKQKLKLEKSPAIFSLFR